MATFQPSELSALQNPSEQQLNVPRIVIYEDKPSVITPWRVVSFAASLAAPALSYQRNGSIPWALGAWLIAPIYVTYRGVDYLKKGKL